ncbi:MAG TPA: acireductone synthase [Pyrinomonadaceae bacterium]|nr:acireductone synthase [Pyrinomonadaceae bacterium]
MTTFSLAAAGVSSILLDIEGTTTPISFVYEVLFPFARAKAKAFLDKHFDSAEFQEVLELLTTEHKADLLQDPPPPNLISHTRAEQIESLVAYVHWMMDRDRKSTGLKSLQGRIWEQGYREGILLAEVFNDVPPALRRWHDAGMKIAIFSSGSVLAQKLLFSHTNKGDLTTLIEHYFDTTIGPKSRSESYRDIAAAVGINATELLFVSDVTAELKAAHEAQMSTLLCIRPGNHPQPDEDKYQVIHSFDEVV